MASRALCLLLLAAAATAASVGDAAAACSPDVHAEYIIRDCVVGSTPSPECCRSLFAPLPNGAYECVCSVTRSTFSVSAGLSTDDFVGWFGMCGGNGDELAATCSRATPPPGQSRQDGQSPSVPVAPPPPTSPNPVAPPPPSPVLATPQPRQPEVTWKKDVIIAAMILATGMICVGALFACINWCPGPVRDLATSIVTRTVDAVIQRLTEGRLAPNSTHNNLNRGNNHSERFWRTAPAATVWPYGDESAAYNSEVELREMNAQQLPMPRPSIGREGEPKLLLANHLAVKLTRTNSCFYRYFVLIKSEDGGTVNLKTVRQKVMDKIMMSDIGANGFAYDGGQCLFTLRALQLHRPQFHVILDETSSRLGPGAETPTQSDRMQIRKQGTKGFEVTIRYEATMPLNSADLSQGIMSAHTSFALRILNLVLRQQHAIRNGIENLVDLTGGISGCYGIYSCFRATVGGLVLNMDVSTTMIVSPGPVIDFLLSSQNVNDNKDIDWPKAKKTLKNLRVKARHNNMEFKIIGMSAQPCSKQIELQEVTVQEYFQSKNVSITMPFLPCLDVGEPGHPSYLPIELSELISHQRYTKELSSEQRAILVKKSRQKPRERMRVITDARNSIRYVDDQLFSWFGLEIEKDLMPICSRVLSLPMLTVGNGEKFIPHRGSWNYDDKKLLDPVNIDHWAIVNFSADCDIGKLSKELIMCGRSRGICIQSPYALLNEDNGAIRCSPFERVERMFEKLRVNCPNAPPKFLLCVLPQRKNCDIYGPWKKKNLHEMGIVTQCIAPISKIKLQYLNNVLLKINTKLGGINVKLASTDSQMIPSVFEIPTLILGMDVSHGSSGRADVPSIAAVVGSRYWPTISKYGAAVRIQSPKVETIDSLFKLQDDGSDDGIIRELLQDYYETSQQKKPLQIIIFRDGDSESQFNEVLNYELNQIIKAYESMGWGVRPKFTVIVAQKNHHTQFFRGGSSDNIVPGTVVDTGIVHPRQYDFYMCAHAGPIGTSRPIHYHVLLDEIGFSTDDLQKLVLSLSYVYQRSSNGISVVAPIRYAHLAAAQMAKIMDVTEGNPELPKLHSNVSKSMFFC